MIVRLIKDLLALDKWEGVSEEIDIAKGKNQLQTTFRGSWEQYKRKRKWRK